MVLKDKTEKRGKDQYATENIMSDGMLPPVSADELINERVKYMARRGEGENSDQKGQNKPPGEYLVQNKRS